MSHLMQWEGSAEDVLAQQPVHPHLPLPGVAVLCRGQDLVELQGNAGRGEGDAAVPCDGDMGSHHQSAFQLPDAEWQEQGFSPSLLIASRVISTQQTSLGPLRP